MTPGSRALPGANGAPGVGGLSAYYPLGIGRFTIGTEHRATATLGTLNLPAGNYAIVANTHFANFDGDTQDASCSLVGATFDGGATSFSESLQGEGGEYSQDPVSLATRATLTAPGSVSLQCSGFKLVINNGTFTALSVQ